MSIFNRLCSLNLLLILLFILASIGILLAVLPKGQLAQQLTSQQIAAAAIQQRGGTVIWDLARKDGLPPDVITVILNDTVVDTKLKQSLGQFTGIEQLTLDGAQLQPQDWAILGGMPRLRSLSVSQSNITDVGASQLPSGLTRLSINATAITDMTMPTLAAMNGLYDLKISDTKVTADGLRLLETSESIQTLWVSDSCITAESVESLKRMQLQSLDVAVSEDLGRRAYDLLSLWSGPDISGHHRDGYVLWTADTAWSHTLAGVVEAVVTETALDPQQAARLLDILAKQEPPEGSWGPIVREPPPSVSAVSFSTNTQDQGLVLTSVDAFVRELQKRPIGTTRTGVYSDWDYWAVRRFAREQFSVNDLPHLMTSIRATQFSPNDRLLWFGPFLLVHHGIDDPDVRAELDRLLTHEDSFVQVPAICAFGYGGAKAVYSPEEWNAREDADAFAVPRLMRVCEDSTEDPWARETASQVLAEIVLRRPQYATEVILVIISLFEEEDLSNLQRLSQVEIPQFTKVDEDIALAAVPTLRAILKKLDEQLEGDAAARIQHPNSVLSPLRRRSFVLAALSAIAHHDPTLAHEIALEYLDRIKDGRAAGPFDTLLSSKTPEANRKVVIALISNVDEGSELAFVAKKIRDQRTSLEPVGQ